MGMALRSVKFTGLKSLPPSSVSIALSSLGEAAATAVVAALAWRKARREILKFNMSMVRSPRYSEIGLHDLAADQDGIAQRHSPHQQQQGSEHHATLLASKWREQEQDGRGGAEQNADPDENGAKRAAGHEHEGQFLTGAAVGRGAQQGNQHCSHRAPGPQHDLAQHDQQFLLLASQERSHGSAGYQ